jgi:AraC-like DNA-binding protein
MPDGARPTGPPCDGCNEYDGCDQRVGWLSGLPGLIRQLGVEPEPLLATVGLAPDALSDPDATVPYVALGRLIGVAAARTGCAHFGLLAGRLTRLSELGLVGEMVRNSATVGEALRTFMVHQHVNSRGGLVFLVDRGNAVDFGYAIYHPGVTPARDAYDCVLASCFYTLRELCGPGFAPLEVFVPHSAPADPSHYRNLFKVHPHFNAEFCGVRFSAKWLQRPIEGAVPYRRQRAIREAERAGRSEIVQRVQRALRILLLQGRNSGDEVAGMLAMHRRTLNRRLKERGTTFQHVLDDVRLEVARQLLSESDIPLDDVAAALGYAGVSPFMRTFRRWTGMTPDKWRRAATRISRAAGENGPTARRVVTESPAHPGGHSGVAPVS